MHTASDLIRILPFAIVWTCCCACLRLCESIALGDQLLLCWRRIALHQLGDGFVQILLAFLRVGLEIHRVAGYSSPHQLVLRGIVHVYRELPFVDPRDFLCGSASNAWNVPAGYVPAWACAPAGIESGKCLVYAFSGLVANEKISTTVAIDLRKAPPSERSIQCRLDLLIRKFVNRRLTLQSDPLIRPKLREVGRIVKVVADILA